MIDAATGKVSADIPGQTGNHGVALSPDTGRGFITDGKDASVFIFDSKSNQLHGKLKAVPVSDGIIYDPASKKIVFVSGDGGTAFSLAPDVDPQ